MTHQFDRTPRPTHSPWGAVQDADQVMPGIWSVGTSSHGGFQVSAERMAASGFLREFAPLSFNGQGKAGWFEEDCDWCFIPLAFPDEWRAWRGDRADAEIVEAQRVFDQWIKPKADAA